MLRKTIFTILALSIVLLRPGSARAQRQLHFNWQTPVPDSQSMESDSYLLNDGVCAGAGCKGQQSNQASGPRGIAGSVDKRLMGTWSATVPTAKGILHMWFTPNSGGTYRTALELGSVPLPADRGSIRAMNGRWSRLGTNGVPDHGTYAFSGPDSVTFTTMYGAPVVYHRVSSGE